MEYNNTTTLWMGPTCRVSTNSHEESGEVDVVSLLDAVRWHHCFGLIHKSTSIIIIEVYIYIYIDVM